MHKEFFEQQTDQMDNVPAPGYNGDGPSTPQTSGRQTIRAYHGTPAEFDHFQPGDTNVGIHFGTSEQAETRLHQLGSSGRIIEADLTYENLKPLRRDEFASPHHPYGFAERILNAGDFTDAEKTYVREHGGRYSYLRRQMADLQDELTIAAQRYELYKDEKYLRQAGEIADRIDKIGAERQIEEVRLQNLAKHQSGEELSKDELYRALSSIENRELEQTFRELGYDGFSYPNDYEGGRDLLCGLWR